MSRWWSSSSFSSPALPQSHYQQHQSVFDLFLRELHFNDLGQKNYYYLLICQEVNPKWPSLDCRAAHWTILEQKVGKHKIPSPKFIYISFSVFLIQYDLLRTSATNVFVRENVRRNTNIHIYILELMISSSRGAALIMFKNGSCFMWT